MSRPQLERARACLHCLEDTDYLSYGVVYPYNYTEMWEDQICFNRLKLDITSEALVFARIPYPYRELAEEYLIWLDTDSRLAPAFSAFNAGHNVVLKINRLTLQALQAVRYLRDSYSIVENWHRFCRNTDPETSFMAAHLVMNSGQELVFTRALLNNHTVFSAKLSIPRAVLSFLRSYGVTDVPKE